MSWHHRVGVPMLLTAALLVALSNCSEGTRDALFVPMVGEEAVPHREAVAALSKRPGVTKVDVVSLDVSLLERAELQLEVGASKLKATRRELVRRSDADLTWIGSVAGGEVVLVARGDQVTGRIRRQGESWELRPLGRGAHALVTVDYDSLPPDDPPSAPFATGKSQCTPPPGNAADFAKVPIDVLVAYTKKAKELSPDIEPWIQLQIDEANLVHRNSGVHAEFRLVHTYETDYQDTNDQTDLRRFRENGDGFMDEVHGLRDAYCADVAILVSWRWSDICGRATDVSVDESGAFALLRYDCANYTLAHEIGHLMCAEHQVYPGVPQTGPYSFNHGFRHPTSSTPLEDPPWRTVMAEPCAAPGCDKVPHWSNPNVTYNGLPTGTADKENNALVLNLNRRRIAGFRDCTPGRSCDRLVDRLNRSIGALMHFCSSTQVDPRCFADGCPLDVLGATPLVRTTLEQLPGLRSGNAITLPKGLARLGPSDADAWIRAQPTLLGGAQPPAAAAGGAQLCEGISSQVTSLGKSLQVCTSALSPP